MDPAFYQLSRIGDRELALEKAMGWMEARRSQDTRDFEILGDTEPNLLRVLPTDRGRQISQLGCGVSVHSGHHMGVSAECEGNRRMAEHLLDDTRMHALLEH